jgi:hypothetical protein
MPEVNSGGRGNDKHRKQHQLAKPVYGGPPPAATGLDDWQMLCFCSLVSNSAAIPTRSPMSQRRRPEFPFPIAWSVAAQLRPPRGCTDHHPNCGTCWLESNLLLKRPLRNCLSPATNFIHFFKICTPQRPCDLASCPYFSIVVRENCEPRIVQFGLRMRCSIGPSGHSRQRRRRSKLSRRHSSFTTPPPLLYITGNCAESNNATTVIS